MIADIDLQKQLLGPISDEQLTLFADHADQSDPLARWRDRRHLETGEAPIDLERRRRMAGH